MTMKKDSCPPTTVHEHGPVYRDFANIAEHDIHQDLTTKSSNFPAKLHYVLSDMEKEGLQHIASWQTHGRCFSVHDKKLFTQRILPFWFRQSKFDSFQRQLNVYGFVRIASGPDKGGYYHELFLRGKSFLTPGIHRNKTMHRTPQQQERERNLNLRLFPSLPETKHHAKNSAPRVAKPDQHPLAIQVPKNVKPSLPMKVHDIFACEISSPTRQVESYMRPSLPPCVMRTTTKTWSHCPWVISTAKFSLVDIVLFHQLKRHHGSSSTC